MKTFLLPTHSLKYNEEGVFSELFQDRFHSSSGALDEVQYVFIEGNSVTTRWDKKKDFFISELGFGFGVSFLQTSQEWLTTNSKEKDKSNILHYYAIEGFPQSKESMRLFYEKFYSSQSNHPTKTFLEKLLDQYPHQIRGTHRLIFEEESILLTLSFSNIEDALPNITHSTDAWFLDGFTPSKNPDMWTDKIFTHLFCTTREGGTFSTYSASAKVRKAAQNAGFRVESKKGFGYKREMLLGSRDSSVNLPNKKSHHNSESSHRRNKIAVIGGGLAGASLAYSLSLRGEEVHLFEKEASLSTKASGNKAAVIMPHLSSVPDHLCRYFLSGYLHSLGVIKNISKKAQLQTLKMNGIIRLGNVNKWRSIIDKLKELGLESIARKISPHESEILSGMKCNENALYFPEGAQIQPSELVERLIEKVEHIHLNCTVSTVIHKEHSIELQLAGKTSQEFDYIVLASAYETIHFKGFEWLPIEKIKGQVFELKDTNCKSPLIPLCYDGYAIPLSENELFLGATYEHDSHEEDFSGESVVEDLSQRFKKNFPDTQIDGVVNNPRVCFRTASPDRLPLVGIMPTENQTESRCYLSLGHGSRGTISTLLGAEIITALIRKEPMPIESDLLAELAPERFLMRAKRKEKKIENLYPACFKWRKT